MKIVKKGLFGEKNVSLKFIYKDQRKNGCSYKTLINEFTSDLSLKNLIFQFIDNLEYNISMKVLKSQLSLLSPLTLDDKIKILNMTLKYKWKSLVPAYEVLTKNKFDNISKPQERANKLDIVDESF